MESNTDIFYDETPTSIKFYKRPAYNPGNKTEKVSKSSEVDQQILDMIKKLEKQLLNDTPTKSKYGGKEDNDLYNMLIDLQKNSNNDQKLKEYLKGLKQGSREKLLNALVEGQLYSLKFK